MQQTKQQTAAALWELFTTFFRIGLFTFGGGYAMLPLVEKEVIDKKGWTDKEEILSIYALAQSVPGVIAVNTSLILGNRLAGVKGAVAAGAGVIMPSLIVIVAIAAFFSQIQDNFYILQAFSGIRAAVVGLVAAAAVRIAHPALKDKPAVLIALSAFLLSAFTDLHAVVIIGAGAVAGLAVYYLGERRAES